MRAQFFGKTFWISLIGLAATFAISALVFDTPYVLLILILVAIGVFLVTFKKLEIGLLFAFAELFANSHGHLMFVDLHGFQFGLRMVIFTAVMLAWLSRVWLGRSPWPYQMTRLKIFSPLFLAILLGFLNGYLRHGLSLTFSDGNAYLYLAYLLPILSVTWNALLRRQLLQVLTAAALWVSILTLGLLFIFSHFSDAGFLGAIYRFIRDTRTGELTQMSPGLFRVFMPAQLTLGLVLLLWLPLSWLKRQGRAAWWSLLTLGSILSAALLISLSRSFWFGLFVALFGLIALCLRFAWPGWHSVLRSGGSFLLLSILSLASLIIVILLPFGSSIVSFNNLSDVLSSRATGTADSAIDSRWKLLDPMLDLIKASPLIGYGFGQEVAFITDDPRIRASIPDGYYETYALEWGWFELWLKMGIVGPLSFLFIFLMLGRDLLSYRHAKNAWLGFGLFAGLLLIAATHIFSPYLNHPLGLGYLLFLLPFLPEPKPAWPAGVQVLSPLLSNKATANSVISSRS